MFALLADRWQPGIRVLEVGSGSGGAAEWTDAEIVGVDPAFERTSERKRPNLIEHPGSVTAIPMPDASFDAVLCLDMLEHVPPADRPQAIAELTRVLAPGGRLLLTFPSGPAAEKLDRWLAAAYAARHGKPHPWAAEHLDLGLPDANEIAALARATGATRHRPTERLGAGLALPPRHLHRGARAAVHVAALPPPARDARLPRARPPEPLAGVPGDRGRRPSRSVEPPGATTILRQQ